MIRVLIRIVLLSDAEPGTGLGNEVINGLVPTDGQGRPIIPASHIKGLLRDQVKDLCQLRKWPREIAAVLFGEPGDTKTDGVGLSGRLSVGDARASQPVQLTTITRTRVTPLGTADANSLRTVQAIPMGTAFTAELRLEAERESVEDLMLRLALMCTEALGGGRTRGAGRCRIEIEGEERTPGELLRLVDPAARRCQLERRACNAATGRALGAGSAVWCRLIFRATTPICCPEVPINGSTNHVRSGPVIPASAVQGALLWRIDGKNPGLATACLLDPRFRSWPLVPVLHAGEGDTLETKGIPIGVRVDLSHRMSKVADSHGKHRFQDPAVEPIHWSENPSGTPLKSSDGILRRSSDGTIDLWRAVDLPRRISAHGVHHDPSGGQRRNLFSVEALAPLVFSGLVALPPEAADCLEELLSKDGTVAFGKARSIRGAGVLTLERVPTSELFSPDWPAGAPGRVFIVQSPVAIPDGFRFARDGWAMSAEEAIQELAKGWGWGDVELTTPRRIADRERQVARTAAACGVRFGWNRHAIGELADTRHRRLRARRVFLPGCVLVFATPIADLENKLLEGLGEGREEGFGCLLPHPGIAQALYTPHRSSSVERLQSRNQAGVEGRRLFTDAGGADGPSPSQISTLASRAAAAPGQALAHLERQLRRGAARHWHRWEPVTQRLETLFKEDPALARGALRVWQDLAIIHRKQKDGNPHA